ncbi:DUF6438 domain-containing protein [Flammeovirgaceae bacterium SG7u.111]|nr:DUF6438 domain-containing protein [Flammeovirgaceae bacterium SG7u.132]WPO35090.1 DUF6438 domain-containing protein [Flammeovirgaceae bacterium SG7u.111]
MRDFKLKELFYTLLILKLLLISACSKDEITISKQDLVNKDWSLLTNEYFYLDESIFRIDTSIYESGIIFFNGSDTDRKGNERIASIENDRIYLQINKKKKLFGTITYLTADTLKISLEEYLDFNIPVLGDFTLPEKELLFYNDDIDSSESMSFNSISISFSSCWGSCNEQQLEIDRKGNVKYNGINSYAKYQGFHVGTLTEEQLKTIGSLLNKATKNELRTFYQSPEISGEHLRLVHMIVDVGMSYQLKLLNGHDRVDTRLLPLWNYLDTLDDIIDMQAIQTPLSFKTKVFKGNWQANPYCSMN